MPKKNRTDPNAYTQRNIVKLVRGGKHFFDLLLKLINESEKILHLQFYIFLEDETGKTVIEALKKAAGRKVAVFLHIDAYASKALPRRCINEMREAGIHVKRFEPLLRSRHFYFGRRLHHKLVVADGLYSLVGGRNVSDRYNDLPGEPAWMDFAIYCEGEASLTALQLSRQMWKDLKRSPPINHDLLEAFYKELPEKEHTLVRVRRNDWVRRKNQIHNSYLEMFDHAEKRITIMCSYFLPGSVYQKKLSRAAKRGVDIKVILAGISDIKVAKNAERYLYEWLLKNKIGIYEYQPTVLHAKAAVYDGKWATIGSYNVNNISAQASLELNYDVKDKHFGKDVEKELDHIMATRCKQITLDNYERSTGFFRRVWQHACYLFINNVLKLFTFYFKQE